MSALSPLARRAVQRLAWCRQDHYVQVSSAEYWYNLDINALVAFHERSGKLATVTGIRPVTRFGELRVDGGIATEFREKQPLHEGWVNGGFFVFERGVLDRLTDASSLGGASAPAPDGEALEQLAAERQLAVYTHTGYWRAMDTIREKRILEEEWATGRAPWKVW